MRILAYTSPARGHLHPMVPPLLALRERGAEVHVRTLAAGVAGVRAAGLACEPIDPRIEQLELDDHRARSQVEAGRRTFEVWARRAPLEVEDFRAAVAVVRPDVALVDTTTFGARAAAEAASLRWAESRPFLLEDPAPGVPPFGLGLRPRGDLAGRVRDRLLGQVVARFDAQARLPAINAGRRAAGLAPLGSAAEARHRAALTLLCTAPPFDYPRPPIAGVLPVGPLVWDPPATLDPEVAAALDADARPLVLVSCSSEFQDDGVFAAAAIEGLSDRFLVVVTSAGVDPASLPARGGAIVRRFLPHGRLLMRAAAVVCHGGMGVTQKALAAGVPVVVVPWGRDQLDVAAHLLEADAGARVPRRRLTPARLEQAVEQARGKTAGAAAVAAGYAATGGATAAADALAALGPTGAATARHGWTAPPGAGTRAPRLRCPGWPRREEDRASPPAPAARSAGSTRRS